jgi:trimeric autotransporter adhesin
MRESGLIKRATELRGRLGPRRRSRARSGAAGGSGLAHASRIRATLETKGSSSEGISEDDRRDIADEIDQVSRANRLSARPEDFVVRPRRKGFVFPLAVNVLALAATAGAIFLLSQIFRQRDLELAGSAASLETAEGKLLRELKRESESRLLEKDRAIADFRSRITELDGERDRLAAGIDERVRATEAELRARLKVEVDAERERLAALSMSVSARDARLKAYETEKAAALDRVLAEDRVKADAEKSAAEEKYRQLKDDFQKSIASLGEERRRLQDEASAREAEIRARAEASARQLEARGAAAVAGLEQAKAELSALEQRKAGRDAVEERVLGLYGGMIVAVRERRYESAVAGADALEAYLRGPEYAADSGLEARKDADLFVAQTIRAYAGSELARSAADAGMLLQQAALLASAREAAAAAQAALKEGDSATAQARYSEALAKVPEILAAHEYFMDRLNAEEAARRSRLEEGLAAAERAFRAGDLALMKARYSTALEYLPVSEASREDLIGRLGKAAAPAAVPASDAAAAKREPAVADTAAARGAAMSAAKRLAAEDWSGAILEYVRLIAEHPAADQVGEALKGITASSAGLRGAFESAQSASKAALKSEAERADAASRTAARAAEDLAASRQSEAALRGDLVTLKKQLADEREKTARMAESSESASAAAASAARDGRIEELEAEVARLKAAADSHAGLLASYTTFRAAEAAAGARGGPEGLLASSAELDAFLGGEAVRSAMPDLRESVARYEQAYQRAGQREVLYNALDLLEGAVGAKDAAARERYYKGLEGRYSGDEAMLDFIGGLRKNLK